MEDDGPVLPGSTIAVHDAEMKRILRWNIFVVYISL